MKGAVKVFCFFVIGCNLIIFLTRLQINGQIIETTNQSFKQSCLETMKDWQKSELSEEGIIEKVNQYFEPKYKNVQYRFILTGYLEKPKMMKVILEMKYLNKQYRFEEVLVEEVMRNED